jgi:hypothetical protein
LSPDRDQAAIDGCLRNGNISTSQYIINRFPPVAPNISLLHAGQSKLGINPTSTPQNHVGVNHDTFRSSTNTNGPRGIAGEILTHWKMQICANSLIGNIDHFGSWIGIDRDELHTLVAIFLFEFL